MEITLEQKDAVNATLKINMTEDDYKPKVNSKLKEYSKNAQIKGFRPGKVPTSLIQKMYGKSILVEEINHLLSHSVTDYIKNNELEIIGDPLPDTKKDGDVDWDNQKEFQFCYDLGLVPPFSCDVASIQLNKYDIELNENAINTTLNNLKKQFGKTEDAEISESGHSLYVNIQQGEKEPVKAMLYLDKVSQSEVEKFVGKKKDDVIKTDITKLFDEPHVLAHLMGLKTEEAQELTGEYEFTMLNINRQEDASMDQEFFDKVFGKDKVEGEEAFKKKLTEVINENYEIETRYLFQRDLKDIVVQQIPLELPEAFLKRWLLISNEGKIDEETVEKEFPFYLKELQWNLIKNKIGKDNNIKVDDALILQKAKENIKKQFGGMDFTGELEETFNRITDNYLKQDKGKNYMNIYEELFADQIAGLFLTNAQVTHKKISLEEFEKFATAA